MRLDAKPAISTVTLGGPGRQKRFRGCAARIKPLFSLSFIHFTSLYMAPSAVVGDGVGIAHLPNQRHKIVSKRGVNFTVMVCGKLRLDDVLAKQ